MPFLLFLWYFKLFLYETTKFKFGGRDWFWKFFLKRSVKWIFASYWHFPWGWWAPHFYLSSVGQVHFLPWSFLLLSHTPSFLLPRSQALLPKHPCALPTCISRNPLTCPLLPLTFGASLTCLFLPHPTCLSMPFDNNTL